MRRLALALVALVALALPARAQTADVVASCAPTAYLTAGKPGRLTVNTQGQLCGVAAVTGGGDATAANQVTGNNSLASILAKIIAAPATEAKQDTGNTSLASILAKIIAAPATEAKQDTAITAAQPATNLATAQVSVTTGNISVAATRALRRSVKITNVTGTSAIYCGNTGVSTSTGDYLGATTGSFVVYNTTAAIFCTVAATTQTVSVSETY